MEKLRSDDDVHVKNCYLNADDDDGDSNKID